MYNSPLRVNNPCILLPLPAHAALRINNSQGLVVYTLSIHHSLGFIITPCNIMPYRTILFHTIRYPTIPPRTRSYTITILYHTVLYTIQYHTITYIISSYRTIPYIHTICTVQDTIIIPYCTIPYVPYKIL